MVTYDIFLLYFYQCVYFCRFIYIDILVYFYIIHIHMVTYDIFLLGYGEYLHEYVKDHLYEPVSSS